MIHLSCDWSSFMSINRKLSKWRHISKKCYKTLCKTRCEKIVLQKRFWNALWDRCCWKDVVRKSILRKTFWERRCENDAVRKTLWEKTLWERYDKINLKKEVVRKTLWEKHCRLRRCERCCVNYIVRKTMWERHCEKDVVRKTWERRYEEDVVRKTLRERRRFIFDCASP